jgi:hypothetical protein
VPFSPGYSATLVIGGVDISLYIKDVKFHPTRKEFDLPVLGGGTVRTMVGPVKTVVDIQGFIDPVATAVFSARMAEVIPVAQAVVYRPQGAGVGGSRSCNAFIVDYDEHTPSEGPGAFTAKLGVDGLVTYA